MQNGGDNIHASHIESAEFSFHWPAADGFARLHPDKLA
jgi:hypothetical protein